MFLFTFPTLLTFFSFPFLFFPTFPFSPFTAFTLVLKSLITKQRSHIFSPPLSPVPFLLFPLLFPRPVRLTNKKKRESTKKKRRIYKTSQTSGDVACPPFLFSFSSFFFFPPPPLSLPFLSNVGPTVQLKDISLFYE